MNFDKITNFRLINAVLVTFGLNIMLPLLLQLRGTYLSATVISIFILLSTLSVKTNRYLVNRFNISQLYKLGTLSHALLVLVFILYFIYKPITFLVIEYLVSILTTAIFSAYSLSLDVYQTKHFPKDVQEFKIVRNSWIANSLSLGLVIATILTYFFSQYVNVLVFVMYHTVFGIWLFCKWNYIEKFILD